MTNTKTPEKVHPETLVLRAKPRRVVRFRRNLMIGVGAAGSLALAAIAWIGLSPPLIRAGATQEKAADLEKRVRPPTESLSGLPKTYADVPQLGPPLPGDLGGPMLEAQRAELPPGAEVPGIQGPQQVAAGGAAAETPTGGLFVSVSQPYPPLSTIEVGKPTATVRKGSDLKVAAGTIIAATLITGLNSDLPGVVLAQITEPVFDSRSGRIIVIPLGSRLIGRYERATGARQQRINVSWDKLVLPDGRVATLKDALAADESGFVGLKDRVDYHPGALAKGLGLSTILALADSRRGGDESDLTRALQEAAGRTFNEAGQKIIQQAVDAPATITVRPGWPVRIILTDILTVENTH
ncbi:TrbI/VirB10 family protein [Asticcacaulis excentricus]|uniref:Conjugation TrbI family protein n=1 Tax=Asticcacaulis excentricus (strain ATCC 15261 / DSM 4724 / KCTC 12464 / NCIMB 9791 / VKM B-1370 / CB 48) TaxID=573065 RepID=E8RS44_ASTEC|nr:TrbI/VirB10 family protein [Asticcacaulis excentricus]ADU14315.1 conjugation TrbI family protein [Asticcacaulis excentricus CB 48]